MADLPQRLEALGRRSGGHSPSPTPHCRPFQGLLRHNELTAIGTSIGELQSPCTRNRHALRFPAAAQDRAMQGVFWRTGDAARRAGRVQVARRGYGKVTLSRDGTGWSRASIKPANHHVPAVPSPGWGSTVLDKHPPRSNVAGTSCSLRWCWVAVVILCERRQVADAETTPTVWVHFPAGNSPPALPENQGDTAQAAPSMLEGLEFC